MPSRPSKCSAATHLEWTDSSLLYLVASRASIRVRLTEAACAPQSGNVYDLDFTVATYAGQICEDDAKPEFTFDFFREPL